jgi:hypothetical protein
MDNIYLQENMMAQIIQKTFVVTISKLVKDNTEQDLLTNEQTLNVLETIPTIIEELVADPSLIVETSLA